MDLPPASQWITGTTPDHSHTGVLYIHTLLYDAIMYYNAMANKRCAELGLWIDFVYSFLFFITDGDFM